VARALPSDKSRLVRLSQQQGLVVGMTGDGINDAPALKKADVGFAMGSGTEVAKEAGDIVILDDNFSSIAKAILYGRTIFKSIRKFIVFQLTMNLCAVGVSVFGPMLGVDTPVTVVQMLWVNMIMDTLGGLAFAGEAPLKEYMKEPPKRRDEPILNRYMVNQILITGLSTMGLCLFFLKSDKIRSLFCYQSDPLYFLTAFFSLFIFCGVLNSFNARTHRINLFSHLWKNPTFVLIMAAVTGLQLVFIYYGGT
ncbi:MAG: HAD-IC family P-type ATPase, partial [Christensenellales bacterium]